MTSRSDRPYRVTPRDGRSLHEEVAFQWEAVSEQRLADRRALTDERIRLRAALGEEVMYEDDKWIENVRGLPMREIRRRLMERQARHSARNTS